LWTVIWKAVDGLELSERELVLYRRHTGREEAPRVACRELWMLAGRRGGKSENIMLRETWRAIGRMWKDTLSAGELGTIPVIASDRKQARNSLRYLKGLARHAIVAPYVKVIKQDSVEFHTGAIVEVHTASFKASRGYTMPDVVLEECAFYQSEESANPDEEMLKAIRPAKLTVGDARIYGISTPYARRGILYKAYTEHWGKEQDRVLVVNASTLALNPTIPVEEVEEALADDPASGASEYGVEGLVAFRTDVESPLSREAVDAVMMPGRIEMAPERGRRYVAFVDPSGGSQDSFTLAIAHSEGGRAVLDLVRETRPPFSPKAVVKEYAATLGSYGLSAVTGDRYAGLWPRESFAGHGVTYHLSEQTKSELYRALVPAVNAGQVEILDLPRLRAQLVGLERRTAWGGKDSIDHAPGGHDDCANVAAGCLTLAAVGSAAEEVPVDPEVPALELVGPGEAAAVPGEPPGFRLAAAVRQAERDADMEAYAAVEKVLGPEV
jgi:hypothetical protein